MGKRSIKRTRRHRPKRDSSSANQTDRRRSKKIARAVSEPPPLQIRVTDANLRKISCAELNLAHAAVDVDFDSGDVGSVAGGEEGDHAGDFFRFAETLHGNAGQDVFGKFVDSFLGEAGAAKDRSFDGAGSNGVHADIPWEQRSRDGAGEGANRA